MTTRQVETATVLGTVTGTGNASVTVTAYGIGNSPKTISVAVTNGDTASVVGGLVRTALAFDTDVAAMFLVSGSGANVVLTKHVAAANDSTLNIAIDNGTCTGLTAAPTSTNTTAGDGLNHAYCAITDVRNVDVVNVTGATHDDLMTKVINGVSRKIDLFCGRRFYYISETRYYKAKDDYCLDVNDIASSSGITIETDLNGDGVYEYSWSSTDYYMAGYNDVLDNWPYSQIEITPQGLYTFSKQRKGNKITAPFGWPSIPEPVVLACILQSSRVWARFKTPLGQAGASAVGMITLDIPALDPDVEEMLIQYRKLT
jgi:hypothetical protein